MVAESVVSPTDKPPERTIAVARSYSFFDFLGSSVFSKGGVILLNDDGLGC